MDDFRASIAKELSNIPRPKVSISINLNIASPEILNVTEDVDNIPGLSSSWGGRVFSVGTQTVDARISPPFYDESSFIPLESYVSPIAIDQSPHIDSITFRNLVRSIIPDDYSEKIKFGQTGQADLTNLIAQPPSRIVDNPISQPQMVIVDNLIISTIVTTFQLSFTLFTFGKVSIFGMNYADKHWQKIPIVHDYVFQPKAKSKKQEREGSISNLKKRGRKTKSEQQIPSLWDLLFAVLQPPLAFGQLENLLLPSAPYPYQWQGIKFLIDNEHALLADDMGTGKTVMTLVALKILIQQAKVRHVLILCPPSVLYEWKHHLDEWAPELTAYLIRGSQEVRKSLWQMPIHIYVTTYDTLKGDIENELLPKENLGRFDIVILDEAHHIKNMKSKRFRAIKKLQPRRRWALTGTPVQNKIEDLASIFEFVYPGYLTPFDLRPEQIQARIKPYFLRRLKKDVMPELPPKIYGTIELDLDEEQDIAYRRAEAGIRDEFDKILARGEKITKPHIFAKYNMLKQICNFAPGKSVSPKTDSLKEQIEEIIESENKVIVFSQYVDEGVSKLEKILTPYGVAKIVGGQTDTNRMWEIDKFKKNPEVPILIASVRAGGEGLNLTEASYVVHFDHWWNPAVMWQAEDRVHRRGQTKGVNIYSYWMKDTIDERIRQKLKEKGFLFEQIVDGLAEEEIDKSFTDDDWFEVFGYKKMEVAKKPIADVTVWQSMSLSEIREKMYEVTPTDFEELVKELMHCLGYPNVKTTKKSHDGGIDVISTRNTTNGIERVAAQCKRYRGNVDVHTARDFFGAISNDKSIKQGFLVTTGEFTKECLLFCQSSGMIRTISGIEFAKYVKQFGLRA
jgi:superfamily II DNA or RNA helicase